MRQSFAAIALIRRQDQGQTLWLAQWNKGWQAYSFVGGHKHDDESFRECMIRELQEELGLRAEADAVVSAAPLERLEYTDVSQRNGKETAYTIELFEVVPSGNAVLVRIVANPDNCWLSEEEIRTGRAFHDGRQVSPTLKRLLHELSLSTDGEI